MLEEEIEAKQLLIKEFLQRGEVKNARKLSAELQELGKEDYRTKLKRFKLQAMNYMQVNNVDFRGMCEKFGLNVYYTQKIIEGLIEPSETYVDTLLEMITK